ncbi:hypothetical protein DL93DRAFT_1601174 [Clavulina sp. PMI_390]|nr:hypothetical protein DL93DRAFT_1601174 [Clavulina sp. PMI_390]
MHRLTQRAAKALRSDFQRASEVAEWTAHINDSLFASAMEEAGFAARRLKNLLSTGLIPKCHRPGVKKWLEPLRNITHGGRIISRETLDYWIKRLRVMDEIYRREYFSFGNAWQSEETPELRVARAVYEQSCRQTRLRHSHTMSLRREWAKEGISYENFLNLPSVRFVMNSWQESGVVSRSRLGNDDAFVNEMQEALDELRANIFHQIDKQLLIGTIIPAAKDRFAQYNLVEIAHGCSTGLHAHQQSFALFAAALEFPAILFDISHPGLARVKGYSDLAPYPEVLLLARNKSFMLHQRGSQMGLHVLNGLSSPSLMSASMSELMNMGGIFDYECACGESEPTIRRNDDTWLKLLRHLVNYHPDLNVVHFHEQISDEPGHNVPEPGHVIVRLGVTEEELLTLKTNYRQSFNAFRHPSPSPSEESSDWDW